MHSFPSPNPQRPPPLRDYQLEPIRAITASFQNNLGLTFCIQISRQGGKNELSARLEALLLTAHRLSGGAIVKTAPTLEPQLKTSYNRLADYLAADRVPHHTAWPQIHVGRALIDFRSAEPAANVVGATASLLLEADEAQDIDPDIFDARFRPMAATTNATVVMYGTAWRDDSLLQITTNTNADLEKADGLRRNFLIDWRRVAQRVPLYARFIAAERLRLGPAHPLFTTQYELTPLTGEGRLLNPAQITQLQGSHPRLDGPIIGDIYIAGLDLAGEDTGSGALHDRTVLTIGRVARATPDKLLAAAVPVEVVHHTSARGMPHAELIPMLADVLRTWRVRHLTADATGVGETTAALLAAAIPACTVAAFKFTQQTKSDLGFRLITAINTGCLKLYAADGSQDHATTIAEARLARRETRPNNTITFSVPEREGNDDYLISLALLAHAAKDTPIRRAVGRTT